MLKVLHLVRYLSKGLHIQYCSTVYSKNLVINLITKQIILLRYGWIYIHPHPALLPHLNLYLPSLPIPFCRLLVDVQFKVLLLNQLLLPFKLQMIFFFFLFLPNFSHWQPKKYVHLQQGGVSMSDTDTPQTPRTRVRYPFSCP